MNFDEFLEIIRETIREKLPDDIAVIRSSILKNNGIFLHGLCFKKEGRNISPTIYMDSYYDSFLKGENIDGIADRIISVYAENDLEDDFDASFYEDYEKVRGRLRLKIVNFDRNAELLKQIPYTRYYDLALVPYCRVSGTIVGNASIAVRNEHLDMWKVGKEEVIKTAYDNTNADLDGEVIPIFDLIKEMNPFVHSGLAAGDINIDMYVVTNHDRYYGAVYMAYPDRLKELYERFGKDFYIIPSSIHELIILPQNDFSEDMGINDMIREINSNEVSVEEVLSDHVYLYRNSKMQLVY